MYVACVPPQAMLTHLASLKGSAALPVMYLDGSVAAITSPPDMARHLRQLALALADALLSASKAAALGKMPWGAGASANAAAARYIKDTFGTGFFNKLSEDNVGEAPDLVSIQYAYAKMLNRLNAAGTRPVIVIGACATCVC